MKNIFKLTLLGFIGLLVSCSDTDRPVDEVFDGTTRGVVLRTVSSSLELPEGTNDEFFTVLELQGVELSQVDRIDVYVAFEDATPDNGTTTLTETLFESIPASAFTTNERLPRAEVRFNLADLESFFGIDNTDYKGGDRFIVTLELHLTDGRIFTDTNTNAIINGPFYRSPFRYNANIICPVGSDKFLGNYTIQSVTAGAFGVKPWNEGEVVEIKAGAGQTNRVMNPTYGNGIGFNLTPAFRFDLLCGEVVVPDAQRVGLGCSAIGLSYGVAAGDVTADYPYEVGEPIEDETLTLIFSDNSQGDCGGSRNLVTVVMTKN